jgi:hypothetical protein
MACPPLDQLPPARPSSPAAVGRPISVVAHHTTNGTRNTRINLTRPRRGWLHFAAFSWDRLARAPPPTRAARVPERAGNSSASRLLLGHATLAKSFGCWHDRSGADKTQPATAELVRVQESGADHRPGFPARPARCNEPLPNADRARAVQYNEAMFGAERLNDNQVQAAATGNQDALEQVIAALEPQVRLMVAARLSPSPPQFDTIDDLVQDTFMELMRAFPRLQQRTVSGLRSFVSVIASRQVFAELRKHKKAVCPGIRSLDSTVGSFSQSPHSGSCFRDRPLRPPSWRFSMSTWHSYLPNWAN